jgi:hypothetical protein
MMKKNILTMLRRGSDKNKFKEKFENVREAEVKEK